MDRPGTAKNSTLADEDKSSCPSTLPPALCSLTYLAHALIRHCSLLLAHLQKYKLQPFPVLGKGSSNCIQILAGTQRNMKNGCTSQINLWAGDLHHLALMPIMVTCKTQADPLWICSENWTGAVRWSSKAPNSVAPSQLSRTWQEFDAATTQMDEKSLGRIWIHFDTASTR